MIIPQYMYIIYVCIILLIDRDRDIDCSAKLIIKQLGRLKLLTSWAFESLDWERHCPSLRVCHLIPLPSLGNKF